ncbi:MAG: 50S ribosomal protein L29 [Candidatus Poseidoniaceae archaeon]|jgi:ribosomal protein L29|nr:MAG: large subunit ribosomal protein L29 [uncultured Candidatus Poseidoniales archaeon]MBT3451769.1 50S ribosomal protein L29 [Euryarchaeota archaeon]MDA8551393.1 50S ribosomal protein L29 [Candidatus Poseidoniales archaeon]MBT5121977.1 50S ribosomal protein L29 [Euryarchaeota archaeon]MBT5617588.1 50S ribosomal protein L29 [Euryarchaeota archaeon]|tara:strand:- start:113 stop:304 length:192 start_codon:yes stop_codon:yes gene_type:complete
MSYVSNREIASMSKDARESRLLELQEELLQLRAEQALGGTPSNIGAYKATRRSIARLKTHMSQ